MYAIFIDASYILAHNNYGKFLKGAALMKTFDYDDIQLVPNKCVIKSRKEADTSVKFGPHIFKIPVVPANVEASSMKI